MPSGSKRQRQNTLLYNKLVWLGRKVRRERESYMIGFFGDQSWLDIYFLLLVN